MVKPLKDSGKTADFDSHKPSRVKKKIKSSFHPLLVNKTHWYLHKQTK